MSIQQQTGDGAGMITGLGKAVASIFKNKDKSGRQGEFDAASTAHTILLEHQKAEHSHAASEAEKDRLHQLSVMDRVSDKFHDKSRGFSLKSSGNSVEYSASKPEASPKPAATSKPKSPVETAAPASRRSTTTAKPTPRSTQGKFSPIKQALKPARVRKAK